MAYIFCADIYCDDCGEAICQHLKAEGKAPANLCERSYDSDDFPKHCGNDEESDCPDHCATGEDCPNAITLPSGGKVGYLFGELTADGVNYVKEAIAEGGEVAELWAEHYADYLGV